MITPELAGGRDMLFAELVETLIIRSCLNCLHFEEAKEHCGIYNMRPPARVIVFSCKDQWEMDVPF